MKTTITKTDGKYYLNQEGKDARELTVKQPNGWDPTIFLPDDIVTQFNRKLVNTITLDKKLAEGEFVLTVKAPVAPRTQSNQPRTPAKPLEDYLEGEDRDNFIALRTKAEAARKEATKPVPLTPVEKAKLAKERAEAAYAKLLEEAEKAAAQEAEKPADAEPAQEPKVQEPKATKKSKK